MGFLPRGIVTGIGSLPHRDINGAMQFVVESTPQLPYVCQLPNRSDSELMLLQPFAGLSEYLELSEDRSRCEISEDKLEQFVEKVISQPKELSEEGAPCFYSFIDSAHSVGPTPRAVKAQLVGPITLLHSLSYRREPIAKLKEISAVLQDHLLGLAHFQVSMLRQLRKPLLFFLDEPYFAFIKSDDPDLERYLGYLKQFFELLSESGAITGLHCCGPLGVEHLKELDMNLLSFDASQETRGLSYFLKEDWTKEFLGDGGLLAIGYPKQKNAKGLWADFDGAIRESQIDRAQLFRQTLLTPSCGLAGSSEDDARETFQQLSYLSDELAKELDKS